MALLVTDPEVLWLNVMNGALGLVVLICCVVLAGAVIYQLTIASKRREKNIAGAEGEMRTMLGTADDHAFRVPNLGLTMADGGEPTDKDRNSGPKAG